MKPNKSMIVGLICAALCVLCVGLYVMQVDAQSAADRSEALARFGGEQIEVCVARRDIAAGETIDESAIETKTWVSALLPEGAVTSKSQAAGKQVSGSILAGEVISSKRFGAVESALDVPDGLTAVSVPARDVQAVGGALRAGMKADVYAVGTSSTAKLATQALVVATSSQEKGLQATEGFAWVTLAVSPSSVEQLVSAAQNAELYFALPTQEGSEGEGRSS